MFLPYPQDAERTRLRETASREKNWTQVESDELQEPPLHFTDFVKSLESVRPTVSQEDIRKHDEWTKDSGELSNQADVLFWLTNELELSGADGA